MTNTTAYRPLENVSMATLIAVVNRGRYARYGKDFEIALQNELAARRLSERRAN